MGLLDRFKKGLERTRKKVTTGFRAALRIGRNIDEETLRRLEDAMLTGDFGPVTADKLIEVVRTGWTNGKIAEEQEITGYLKRLIISLWPDADRELRFAES